MAEAAQCAHEEADPSSKPASDIEDITALHDAAMSRGEPSYIDPATGYSVFTAATHKARGKCCGCGCRHCPYNHAGVPMADRASRIKAPALLSGSFDALEGDSLVDILFWSGGKDSFLAARRLVRERGRGSLLLMTTFDGASRLVAHQQIQVTEVVRQAKTLELPLLGVPLWPHIPYPERVGDALRLASRHCKLGRVCSGDLHLESVAEWRRQQLGPVCTELGAVLHAPLWRVPYDDLSRELAASSVPCRVCAIAVGPKPGARAGGGAVVGDLFNASLVAKLDEGTDTFGEDGEFHTLAEVWNASVEDPLTQSVGDCP